MRAASWDSVPTGPVEVREVYTGAKLPKNATPPKGPAAWVPAKPSRDGTKTQTSKGDPKAS